MDEATSKNIVFVENNEVWSDSLIFSENFDIAHKHVLEKIKKLSAEFSTDQEMFLETFYRDSKNRKYKKFLISRDGYMFLVMNISTKKANQVKLNFINAFNSMEKSIQTMMIPKNYEEALEQLLISAKKNKNVKVKLKKKEEMLKLQAPDVEIAKSFLKTIRSISVDDWSQVMGEGLGRNTVLKILKYKRYIYKNYTGYRIYQKHIDNGLFEQVWGSKIDEKTKQIQVYKKLMIKPSGLKKFCRKKMLEWKDEIKKTEK